MWSLFFNLPPGLLYPSEWWHSELHPWADIDWFQGHKYCSSISAALFIRSASKHHLEATYENWCPPLPPQKKKIGLPTKETQLISKSKTFIAEHDHPSYLPVWALMTFSCLFKYSLFSEDKDLTPVRKFKYALGSACNWLWMQLTIGLFPPPNIQWRVCQISWQ